MNKFFVVLVIALLVTSGYFALQNNSKSNELDTLRTANNNLNEDNQHLNVDHQLYNKLLKVSFAYDDDSIEAERLYEESSLAYEDNEYSEAIRTCEHARDHYFAHIQNIYKEKAIFSNYTENIFKIYIDILTEDVKINENKYEACEWSETACRAYDKYFNNRGADTFFNQGSDAITELNKKIGNHDDAVRRYNYLLEQYKLELSRLSTELDNE